MTLFSKKDCQLSRFSNSCEALTMILNTLSETGWHASFEILLVDLSDETPENAQVRLSKGYEDLFCPNSFARGKLYDRRRSRYLDRQLSNLQLILISIVVD